MAKYDIKHSCGHTVTHNIVGPEKDRPYQAERLTNRLCSECYRELQRSEAAAATSTLPALQGSDKQITWATTIRAKFVGSIEAFEVEQEALIAQDAGKHTDAEYQAVRDQLAAAKAKVFGQAAASWWIDRRSETGQGLLREAAKN